MSYDWFGQFQRRDFSGTGAEHRTKTNPHYTKSTNSKPKRKGPAFETSFGSGFAFRTGYKNSDMAEESDCEDFESPGPRIETVRNFTSGVKSSDYVTVPTKFSELKEDYCSVRAKRKVEDIPLIEEIYDDDEPNGLDKFTTRVKEDNDLEIFASLFDEEERDTSEKSKVIVEVVESDPNYQVLTKSIEKEKNGCFFCKYDTSTSWGKKVEDYFFELIIEKCFTIKKASALTKKFYDENVYKKCQEIGKVMPDMTKEKIEMHFLDHTNDSKSWWSSSVEDWSLTKKKARQDLFVKKVNPRTGEFYLETNKLNLDAMKTAETFLERRHMMKSVISGSGNANDLSIRRLK